ncbi:MAG: hypothetical protein P1U67_07925 [Alcanivoracaceae bacterium]|nr:hypothetical protein [Alcanivoracaceae bacterium]
MMPTHTSNLNAQSNADFNGAAIIDAKGREIPITEEMVREACSKLEQNWAFPATATQCQAG